jgi:ABC-type glycerol-3-phosphate transport system permease component
MIPSQVGLVPLFLMMNWFRWIDTYWAIIVPGAVSAFGIFFMRSSMMGIPDEILDSARIDGASEFSIFSKIVLPMSTASIGILAVLTFTGSWNNFMWPLIVLSSDTKMTLPVGLATLMNLYKVEYGMLMAGSFLSTIPILILLILVGQKAFIRGITVGALKG